MAIRIINKEPDVYVSEDEYRRFLAEYQQAYMMYSGTPPSLETFIRQRKRKREER